MQAFEDRMHKVTLRSEKLQKDLNESHQRIQQLEAEISNLNRIIEELRREVRESKTIISNLEMEIERLKKEIEEIKMIYAGMDCSSSLSEVAGWYEKMSYDKSLLIYFSIRL